MAKTTEKITRYELRIVKVGCVREALDPLTVNSPETLLPHLEQIRNEQQEHFVCASLDCAGHVINVRVITIGLINHSLVHPREVFRGAITDNASTIIVAHNHPSGSLDPSPQDIAITTQLKEAGTILGIQLLDHVIISQNGHYSFSEHGYL